MVLCTGQLRTALHPGSGIRQAIFRNILLAIGCEPEDEGVEHGCKSDQVHIFFALSDEPAHSPASCGRQSCEGDSVEDFVAYFPEHFVKGSYVQEMKHPYTREVRIFACHTSHLTPHTSHTILCARLQPSCPVEWAHSRKNVPQVCDV